MVEVGTFIPVDMYMLLSAWPQASVDATAPCMARHLSTSSLLLIFSWFGSIPPSRAVPRPVRSYSMFSRTLTRHTPTPALHNQAAAAKHLSRREALRQEEEKTTAQPTTTASITPLLTTAGTPACKRPWFVQKPTAICFPAPSPARLPST